LASFDDSVPQPAPRPLDLVPASAKDAAADIATGSTSGPVPQQRQSDVVGAWLSESLSLDISADPQGMPLPPVAIGEGGRAIDLLNSGSIAQATPADIPEGWVVQIGAAPNPDSANILLSDATSKVGPLGDFRKFVQRFEKNGQTFYRARFAGFVDRGKAVAMCEELRKAQLSCLVMQS
jgi:D-alanyl-D-alanine carboxypeptidase